MQDQSLPRIADCVNPVLVGLPPPCDAEQKVAIVSADGLRRVGELPDGGYPPK
jgi:hypothetical protein